MSNKMIRKCAEKTRDACSPGFFATFRKRMDEAILKTAEGGGTRHIFHRHEFMPALSIKQAEKLFGYYCDIYNKEGFMAEVVSASTDFCRFVVNWEHYDLEAENNKESKNE